MMVKRILVALDPDIDTKYATRYATEIARRNNSTVTGMAVVNTQGMYAETGSGSVESIYFAKEMKNVYIERSRQEAGNLLDRFERETGKSGVRHREVMEEGVPSERINEQLKYFDLLIVGRESHFQYLNPDRETKTISNLIKKTSTPILIVPGPHKEVNRVLVALDGQTEAARALRWFVHLQPFGTDLAIDLVHVKDGADEWDPHDAHIMLETSKNYLVDHGFRNVKKKLLDGRSAGDKILEYISSKPVDLAAMGIHSMSVFRRFTVGSTSYSLVKNSPVPLFTVN